MAAIDPLGIGASQVIEKTTGSGGKVGAAKFSETLTGMIDQVDSLQKEAEESVENFISGEESDLHNVMASLEEAQLSFQFMMEVRNKLLEGYHELMRMQV